jgi:hypothetical protein
MKTAAVALVASLVVVACSGSDPSGSAAPTTASPPVTSPSTPVETPVPSPSGNGFCVDRAIIGDVYRLIRAGTVPYRAAAAYVTAAGKVMRADADLAPTELGARKLRQFVLYLNTLRLAILGAVENYRGDFAVRQFNNGLVDRVQDLSGALRCPA